MLEAMFLSALTQPLNATLRGADVSFDSVSIDARQLQPGGLFVALPGSRVDGHDFVAQARANGAVAALVQRPVDDALPQLLVTDCQRALGQLGALNRAAFQYPLVAITGSSGKTTVKEMLAAILRECGPVLATRGNLNNELGVPLTLLELAPEHRFAVIEMGAGAVGDIAYCMQLASPQIGVLTNAGVAHIGRFGSEQAIARTKGEIFDHLAADGQGVINLDSRWYSDWQMTLGARKGWSFSLDNAAGDLHARSIRIDQRGCPGFELVSPAGSIAVQLNLLGRHNVANALAAAAAALALGVSLPAIAAGLGALQPVAGRGKSLAGHAGSLIIDDCYNANPVSVRAAIDVLASLDGQRLLVLGDMGELGEDAATLHAQIGQVARTAGVERLLALGELTKETVAAFGAGAMHFERIQELLAELENELAPDTTVLVKGSRFMQMERVVQSFAEESTGPVARMQGH